ncbi:MAG: alpha-mannosidase [Chloroflexota bacterium]
MIHKTRWTAQKIAKRLELIEPLVYRRKFPLAPFQYTTLANAAENPPLGSEGADRDWQTIAPHSYWGNWTTNFVMRTTFTIPAEWDNNAPVALYLPIGEAHDFSHPEALVYIDGASYAGCDRHHQEIMLRDEWRNGRSHQLTLHGWTGLPDLFSVDLEPKLFMRPCFLVQIDQPTRDFVASVRVALGIADLLDHNEPAKGHLYNALNHAFQLLDTCEPLSDSFYSSVPAAHAALKAGIEKAGPPLDVSIVASGHAHIDIAWLWTVAQSRRKAGRTFHTAIRLMEQFPDYHFTQSQPQLYDYVRQDYPELYEVIKTQVANGRWEAIGGMWVEADCNLSGAEALARQFLLGRSFFREQFGPEAESPVLWLPDVFGYAWNLPQLIKEAGLEYFFTIKISWSQYNRMPYDSFWWQGLDGTKVLTHFSTTQEKGAFYSQEARRPSTYNGEVGPLEAMSSWINLQQKETHQEVLMAYGFGDGGGGPTREMQENIREMAHFPAAPQIRNGRSLDFFRTLEAEAGERLPTWNGELYLEYHRGTYTTQARSKRSNRKSEIMLHDAEFLAAWAALVTEYAYPHTDLTRAWQLLCLNQFHDVLPGTSIAEVYADSQQDYQTIAGICQQTVESALTALTQQVGAATEIIAINPTSFNGRKFALLHEQLDETQTLVNLDTNQPVVTQAVTNGTLIDLPNIGAYGAVRLVQSPRLNQSKTTTNSLKIQQTAGNTILENDLLRIVFDANGDLVSLYDKEVERHILPAGAHANSFQLFEDRPLDWDAWDIDIFYEDQQWPSGPTASLTIIETGPLRVGVEIKQRLLHSEIVQHVYLYHGERRIDFDTWIDWRERHMLLKVAFPVDILAPAATFDVQWGNVQRPTHRNTSWDWGRFESCAHKWVDLSEGDYGVSLLNDCKYGHDIQDNVIRLTLLRSPTTPDPEADQGEHHFIYSLLPHPNDWRSGTVPAAYDLNDPLIVRRIQPSQVSNSSQLPASEVLGASSLAASLLSVDKPHIIIETVKQAEDGNGLIVRLYENERTRGMVTLHTGFPVKEAYRCNLLEEYQEPLEAVENSVRFMITPYQIMTLRIVT